jgi:hypothetical protein
MSQYVFEFCLLLADIAEATSELADRLYESGCDDGTLSSTNGVTTIGFSREAESLEEAVRSAIRDVHAAGVRVTRVESIDGPVYSRINAELASQS